MKRTELRRTKPMKRVAMKKIGKPKQKGNQMEATEEPKTKSKAPAYPTPGQIKGRQLWAEQFNNCMACGHRIIHKPDRFSTLAAEVHHIATRKQAPGKFEEPCNWLLLCHICHIEGVHGFGGNWHIAMLAFKKLADPKCFDLEKWHALIGRPTTYITNHEITAAIEMHNFHQSHAFKNDIRPK